MAGALVVLAATLIVGVGRLLLWLLSLAATSWLAKRNGVKLKSMSCSFVHGYTAEFFQSEEPN